TPVRATSGATLRPLVAGLDLLMVSEKNADAAAIAIAAELQECGATDLTVATHWATVGEFRHVALSVGCSGLAEAALWRALTTAVGVDEALQGGALLADRYTGPIELRPLLEGACNAHVARSSGRLVVYPGMAALTGTCTVAQILTVSVIDCVRVLAGGEGGEETPVVTRDFVRPRWTAGQLVLDTQPAVGGTLVPFETPTPTPCCADHSA
ncbi:MAG: hypothetical protein QOE24_1243, partial [Frankiales bacterium]|nr:hypothetical protein [Frankiales bacterium]